MICCPECGHGRGFHKTPEQRWEGEKRWSHCGFLMGTVARSWNDSGPSGIYCPCGYPDGREIKDAEWESKD